MIEQLPVAALVTAAGRTAVAADGVVLGPALLSASLPLLDGASSGQAVLQSAGQQRPRSPLLACLTVLGAAPAALARAVVRVLPGPDGVTVVMRNGLRAFFGDASRPHAKWLSLANVLADPSSAGASYVDVRVPERPAAGGGVAPEAARRDAGGRHVGVEHRERTRRRPRGGARQLLLAGGLRSACPGARRQRLRQRRRRAARALALKHRQRRAQKRRRRPRLPVGSTLRLNLRLIATERLF